MSGPSPAQQEVKKFSQICSQCKVQTTLVEDHAQGDLICTECGLVVESRTIDECSEWRTFSDSDKAGGDPSRTVGATNNMLSGGGLGTTIGRNPDGSYNQTLARLHNREGNPDKVLMAAFSQIGDMADRMAMNQTVKSGACELYKVVTSSHSTQGKSSVAMFAACLYIACRQEGQTRTFKEICGAAVGSTVKEIGRCYRFIIRVCEGLDLQMQMNEQMITPELLTNRFCGNLGLANSEFIRVCSSAIQKFREIKTGEGYSQKQPASVAAAAIYLATQILDKKDIANVSQISAVSGMAEQTIRNSYADMLPYLERLLPEAYNDRVQMLLASVAKRPTPLLPPSAAATATVKIEPDAKKSEGLETKVGEIKKEEEIKEDAKKEEGSAAVKAEEKKNGVEAVPASS
jgi:transcription initiation factor TFIIB